MPDTRASQTIGSLNIAREAKLRIEQTNIVLRNASDMPMSLSGQSYVLLYNDKHSVETTVLISPNMNHPLLVAWEGLMHLSVIPDSFPAVAATTATSSCFDLLKNKILSSYTEVFSD